MAIEPGSHSGSDRLPPADSRGHFPWKIALTILIIGGIVAFALIRRKNAPAEVAKGGGGRGGAGGTNVPVTAVLGTVQSKDVPIYLDGLGTVQAFNNVTVRSRVEGTLQKIHFQEGQDVKTGDLLAEIDPAPFKAMVAQAVAKKAQDEAQLQNAQIELKRDEALLASKIVAQDVYDTAKAAERQFEAAVQADQAAIDSAKVQLAYTRITAPIDGRTGIRMVDVGNVIRTGDSNGIVSLTQLKPISVLFTLPEQSLSRIQSQQSTSPLKVLAVDRDNRTLLEEGNLTVVDNQIDTTTGTIRLKATFPNEKYRLWPGQFVNARLLLEVRTNAITVPAPVIQRGPNGAYAFVVDQEMNANMAPVQVEQIENNEALVSSGLQAGQRVVVDGQYKLQQGSKVRSADGNRNERQASAAETSTPAIYNKGEGRKSVQ
jgi:multidrug efflux system membrane fusion protein